VCIKGVNPIPVLGNWPKPRTGTRLLVLGNQNRIIRTQLTQFWFVTGYQKLRLKSEFPIFLFFPTNRFPNIFGHSLRALHKLHILLLIFKCIRAPDHDIYMRGTRNLSAEDERQNINTSAHSFMHQLNRLKRSGTMAEPRGGRTTSRTLCLLVV
jgi:hypothetical protein